MLCLHEMGLAKRIPQVAVQKMLSVLGTHYERYFPTKPADIPPGKDPKRHFLCHCALGTIYQTLYACDVDVDVALPWAREWFLKYQLPDGGLNCDEAAYSSTGGKSSVLSSLPPLEAVLYCSKKPLTPQEERFLDAGAQYLIDHRIYRSVKTGGVINEEWLELCFPRFYQFDILRGLAFLVDWSEKRKKPLSRRVIEEPMGLMRAKTRDHQICAERVAHAGIKTLQLGGDDTWVKVDAETFELLDRVSAPATPNPWLTQSWNRIRAILGRGY